MAEMPKIEITVTEIDNFIVPWVTALGMAVPALWLWFLGQEGAATAGWCALGGALYAAVRTWRLARTVRRRLNGVTRDGWP